MKHNGSRNLLAAVSSFSEVYPKAVIDEVIIPCMKKLSLGKLLNTLLVDITVKQNLKNYKVYLYLIVETTIYICIKQNTSKWFLFYVRIFFFYNVFTFIAS